MRIEIIENCVFKKTNCKICYERFDPSWAIAFLYEDGGDHFRGSVCGPCVEKGPEKIAEQMREQAARYTEEAAIEKMHEEIESLRKRADEISASGRWPTVEELEKECEKFRI